MAIVIDSVTFHDASRITSGGPEGESGYTDDGGAAFIVVKNTGTTNEVLDPYATKVNGTAPRNVIGSGSLPTYCPNDSTLMYDIPSRIKGSR